MAWAFLILAGLLEIGFAVGLKLSNGFSNLGPGAVAISTGLASVVLLSFALRTLPVGTGYAVWTGIGAAGTAIVGMAFLGNSTSPTRLLCIMFIMAGVIGLKFVPEF